MESCESCTNNRESKEKGILPMTDFHLPFNSIVWNNLTYKMSVLLHSVGQRATVTELKHFVWQLSACRFTVEIILAVQLICIKIYFVPLKIYIFIHPSMRKDDETVKTNFRLLNNTHPDGWMTSLVILGRWWTNLNDEKWINRFTYLFLVMLYFKLSCVFFYLIFFWFRFSHTIK